MTAAGLDPMRVGAGEVGPRAAALRAARRARARPDAARPRRLVADRAGPLRGDRHADPGRLRARHRARPRARAPDRRRRLPRQAVLDEGARRAGRGGRAARRARPARGPRRGARDRGAADRPALGAGLRRRRERRADADRVPAALRAGAGPRPGGEPRRAAAANLGPSRDPPRPHGRRLRAPPAREDRHAAPRGTRSSRRATASATASSRSRSSYSSRYIGTRLFSASFSMRATTSTYGSRPEPCSFDFSSSSTW